MWLHRFSSSLKLDQLEGTLSNLTPENFEKMSFVVYGKLQFFLCQMNLQTLILLCGTEMCVTYFISEKNRRLKHTSMGC
jgi:hypothetical protein